MHELESGEPADLEVEAPPGLLPNLEEWGIQEVEKGVCEDTFENRKAIRANKGKFNTVFDSNGNPTNLLQVITAEMYAAAQGLSKAQLLQDPDDYNSDYLTGFDLILAPNADHLAPTWVLNTTRMYMRQEDERRDLGPDAPLHQSRLKTVPARCSVIKSDRTRCWGWSSGSADTLGLCRIHARRMGQATPLGMSTNQLMRNRLLSAAPGALERMEMLIDSDDERVAIAAAKDLMDRAGFKAVEQIETKVEVTVSESAQIVQDRLKKLREGQAEKAQLLKRLTGPEPENIEDAEVVTDDDE